MYCTRKILDDLYYVGGSDRKITKFENILDIEHGVSYNSYLFLDEKTCLLDTADQSISRLFLENVTHTLGDRTLDYLVIHHMEPDHCYNINEILLRYPNAKLVGNAQIFKFLHNFFPTLNTEGKEIVVKEGDILDLGKHKLHFYFTPMVHWPEVMMSFDETDDLLFTADAFGTFGALNGKLFNDECDFEKEYLDDARMYYTNIVGKYGVQVQNAFKKLPVDKTKMVLPLHGPVWRENFGWYLNKYQLWSTYTPEDKGVIIVYGSMYGDNENAAEILGGMLAEKGVKDLHIYDASITPVDKLVSEAFRVSNIVLIAPTYNMTIYPAIENYINDFMRMGLQNRTFTLIQNGSWAPNALSLMKTKLSTQKTFTFTPTELTITSSLNETSRQTLASVADEIKNFL